MKEDVSMNYVKAAICMAVCSVFLSACGHGSDDPAPDTTPISMITPYVDRADIGPVHEAFSVDASAPWGFAHDGIDFAPVSGLIPFQAVSSGSLEEVNLWQNDITANWQVNVTLRFNSTYAVVYAFEPFNPDQAEGQVQLDNIAVSVGQSVSQGDVPGHLHAAGSGAHVHFGLIRDNAAVCPESYFTADARNSVLDLIRVYQPAWNMCYEDQEGGEAAASPVCRRASQTCNPGDRGIERVRSLT